ncbi:ABC transporter substrate-binding protein [Spartinivicinus poritis]|uniref:ABC transporter substrate-binding protein n=1 Tax=Spartinivicinus poritis TaxID=2994640 RepID=A0ABT5U8W8_9GAMM|nr:ABC transporter substrate-binding protein [Spartinivicinus sp. A2-2]MDE1462819.1 ABC transporter substrate-binding protein [Spartinivicinus sp. A2-2]
MQYLLLIGLLFGFTVQAKTITHEMGTLELAKTPSKIVTLDWVLTESLLALGVTPYAVADSDGYNQWVVKPQLPSQVKNVGSRREPNLELLTQLKPDLILMSSHLSPLYPSLQAIAPTMVLTVYNKKRDPFSQAKKVLNQLAIVTAKENIVSQLIAEAEQHIQNNGSQLKKAGKSVRPFFLVRFIGDKHIRIHGTHSLVGQTLTMMGLTNAWQGSTNLWGFASTSVDKLALSQQANVIYFGPLNKTDKAKLFSTPLWQAMAFTRSKRVYELPPIWAFGGINAAVRLSDTLTEALMGTSKNALFPR